MSNRHISNRGEILETIILGLLLLEPMTSYELRKHITEKFSMMCSDSAGSIQVALKKLLSCQFIQFTECVENGKNKKRYEITQAGRHKFNDWIKQPMNHRKAKNMELSKLFFMGNVEKEKRASLLTSYLETLRTDWEGLTNMRQGIIASLGGADTSVLSDKTQYQLATLDYGIALFAFEMEWYERLLNQIEEGLHQ